MKDTTFSSPRLEVVDALRGFALFAIVLIHNLEHYNIWYFPESQYTFINSLDKGVWDTIFFLFAGKAFATFSMLFGFSFFIQMDNQARRGYDFRLRFGWRLLLLLLVFAQFHAMFYNGDILVMYALCGFFLLPVCKLSNRAVAVIAFLLLFQPFEWYRMIAALTNPEYTTIIGTFSEKFGEPSLEVLKNNDGLLATFQANLTYGQLHSNFWQIENGRFFQILALFMFGMLLGRLRHFVKSTASIRFWKKTLLIASVSFIIIYGFRTYMTPFIESNTTESFRIAYQVAIGSYQNFCFMCVLVAVFTLLWFKNGSGYAIQRAIIPYGKMSLTNYIGQSIIGSFIYYAYGLRLWETTGATVCLLIGIGIFAIQLIFSRWWLKNHQQGPLEYLWKKLTWIGKK